MTQSFVNPLDMALQAALPTVIQPRHGALGPLEIGGRRHILAANGLFLECRSRGVHVQAQLVGFKLGRCPYGVAGRFRRFGADGDYTLPDSLLIQAIDLARETSPHEWAGLILHTRNGPVLHVPEPSDATATSIRYEWAGIDPLDVIADLHSHGEGPAYFSPTDNVDDLANPSPCFVAGVLGRLNCDDCSVATRLVAGGHFIDLRGLVLLPGSPDCAGQGTGDTGQVSPVQTET